MTNAEVVRRAFEAFQKRERDVFDGLLAEDFSFSSPHDPELDKQGYFERCWPNMEHIRSQTLDRVVEAGNEVFVRYEVERMSGGRFRNAELFKLRYGQIERIEVYYGADVE